MLEPLAVDPNRSVAPAANSIASARLVFPAPAGPTSAITRVPLDSPAAFPTMCESPFVRFTGARVAQKGARAPVGKPPPSACFQPFARGLVTAPTRSVVERARVARGFFRPGRPARKIREAPRG